MGGQWPHFLSVDIEGLDHAVLDGATFGDQRPLMMCIETRDGAGSDTAEFIPAAAQSKGLCADDADMGQPERHPPHRRRRAFASLLASPIKEGRYVA